LNLFSVRTRPRVRAGRGDRAQCRGPVREGAGPARLRGEGAEAAGRRRGQRRPV